MNEFSPPPFLPSSIHLSFFFRPQPRVSVSKATSSSSRTRSSTGRPKEPVRWRRSGQCAHAPARAASRSSRSTRGLRRTRRRRPSATRSPATGPGGLRPRPRPSRATGGPTATSGPRPSQCMTSGGAQSAPLSDCRPKPRHLTCLRHRHRGRVQQVRRCVLQHLPAGYSTRITTITTITTTADRPQ